MHKNGGAHVSTWNNLSWLERQLDVEQQAYVLSRTTTFLSMLLLGSNLLLVVSSCATRIQISCIFQAEKNRRRWSKSPPLMQGWDGYHEVLSARYVVAASITSIMIDTWRRSGRNLLQAYAVLKLEHFMLVFRLFILLRWFWGCPPWIIRQEFEFDSKAIALRSTVGFLLVGVEI